MIKISLAAAVLAAMLRAGPVWAQPSAQQNDKTEATEVAGTLPPDDQAASELREHHRHHHQGGITQFIAMSLDTLGADEAKAPQIKALQHELHACLAPAGKVEKSLLETLADGVAKGSIDAKKVDADVDRLGAVAADAHPCSVKTLNKLHALLSPGERQALADKVEAHWQVWRKVNHEAQAGGREQGGELAELTKELSLKPDQLEKISSQLHAGLPAVAGKLDPKQGERHLQAFSAAFIGESFDAASIMANANSHLATNGAKRMAFFYETVTPLLTSEQRATLAGHLRQHAGQQPSST